jgi:hypothetical protein
MPFTPAHTGSAAVSAGSRGIGNAAIAYDASPEIRDVLSRIGRTEDIADLGDGIDAFVPAGDALLGSG